MKKWICYFLCMIVISNLSANDIYATFNIEADKSSHLAFSSGGIIKDIFVDVSTIVKKDTVIAKLKNDDIKAQVQISKTALKYAKLDYDRQLKVRDMIDKSKFDKYAFKYENAKAQLKYQEAILDKTILKAPFDGMIFEKLADVGDVVSGQSIRTIFKIQSINKRKLILEFDEKYHNNVQVGDIFIYKIDGDTKEYKGKISKIYPDTNIKNRKIKAEVNTKNMMVGLFGDGYIKSKR